MHPSMVSLSIHCLIVYTLASCGFRFCFFFILSIALPPLSITAYTTLFYLHSPRLSIYHLIKPPLLI